MSRFIPEGKSDIKELQAKEKDAYKKFKDEKEDEERLSLYDQMKLNYLAKEQAYEDKIKAKNQSNQFTETDLEFYKQLKQEKDSKEREKKREIEEGLEKFDELKRKKTKANNSLAKQPTDETFVPKKIHIKKVKTVKEPVKSSKNTNKEDTPEKKAEIKPLQNKQPAPSEPALISGYDSSSDSE